MNITIYTRSNCPNCMSAKQLLKAKGLEYTEHSVEDPDKLRQLLAYYPEARQMPQIFYKGERIGGFAGLREWIKWKEAK